MKELNSDIEGHELMSSFKAQLRLMSLHGEKLVAEYQHQTAKTLLSCGCTLIPCDSLQDHQFAVSRGVYDAAKRLLPGG